MSGPSIRRALGPWHVRKGVTCHLPPAQGEVYLPLYPPPQGRLGTQSTRPKVWHEPSKIAISCETVAHFGGHRLTGMPLGALDPPRSAQDPTSRLRRTPRDPPRDPPGPPWDPPGTPPGPPRDPPRDSPGTPRDPPGPPGTPPGTPGSTSRPLEPPSSRFIVNTCPARRNARSD